MASRGYSLVVVLGFLIAAAALVAEPGLQDVKVSVVVTRGLSSCSSQALEHRLNSCGTWAYLLFGMWDLPGSGIEPMSPALVGKFFTTEPPGKPCNFLFLFSQ